MKAKFILIGALVFAIATTFLFSNYIKSLNNKYKDDTNMAQVVVLNQDINKNQRVTKEMLELKSYNANSIHPQAIKNIKDIEGSYALVDMKIGEMLFADRFTDQDKETDLLSRKLKEGYRAISIDANYVESVSTFIEPEDYVDVIFSEKAASGAVNTQTLLENVRVLGVGKRIVETLNATAASSTKTAAETAAKTNQVEYNSITLELNPEQIKIIANADEKGNLKFVLRSELDKK